MWYCENGKFGGDLYQDVTEILVVFVCLCVCG